MINYNVKDVIKNILTFILPVLILSFVLTAVFTGRAGAVYINSSLKNRYVLDLEDIDTNDALTLLDMKIEERIKNSVLYINPYFTYNYQQQEADAELNEVYLDLYFEDFDFRIGKQKMSWGKADGLIVTNLVNPRDYTNYPVLEYEEQLQAVNAARLNYYSGSDTMELVWLPEFKPVLADEEQQLANLNGFTVDNSRKDIETELENSELLIRYSSLGYDFDYEIMLGYIWDDRPALHKDIVNRTIIPEHHRLTVLGGSFSTIQDDYVLRGEAAYTFGKYYNTDDFIKYRDGVVEKQQLKLLAGIDYNYKDYQFSYQVLQGSIMDYEDSIEQDQFTYQMTFMVKRMFWRDTLETEMRLYYDTAVEQLMVQPKLVYDYSDIMNINLGANYQLEGDRRDNVLYFETEYLF